jgi:ATP-dependent DNA helicase RecG
MKISELIKQPEGRRLEFKESLPTSSELSRTIVAFANDAGGELFIGIRNEPRELIGIPEDELMQLEEQISNIIHDQCHPVIVPDISFHGNNGARFMRVTIYKGSNLPYFLKSKGKLNGTYIRVGSTNRVADAEIIAELERQKRNISFDSELLFDIAIEDIHQEPFKAFFNEKTGNTLSVSVLRKLELVKEFQGTLLPTNALVLLSDGQQKRSLFPYAKIECARFKGITSDEFIDQKTIDSGIATQAEQAYEFVLRHINKSALVKGVYTESRWEYPVVAIREAIRNAVVHRDYSLSGKDIKVAIYDDMVEITSPGKLMPSIDFLEMEARQSDIRNKVIAPVFKMIGVIDQWGNGLKLIADELKAYPEIEFRWFERGLQFQVQFINKNPEMKENIELLTELDATLGTELGTMLGLSWDQVGTKSGTKLGTKLGTKSGTKLAPSWHQIDQLLSLAVKPVTMNEMMDLLDWKDRTKFRNKFINPFLETGVMLMTSPDKPKSSRQKYYLSEKGKAFLVELHKQNS